MKCPKCLNEMVFKPKGSTATSLVDKYVCPACLHEVKAEGVAHEGADPAGTRTLLD
jgi:hypothetical protein